MKTASNGSRSAHRNGKSNPSRKNTAKNAAYDMDAQIPIQNMDAEMSVLGSMILAYQLDRKEHIERALVLLTPQKFYREAHQLLFTLIRELYLAGDPVGIFSLKQKLMEQKKLEDIGGQAYLNFIAESVPSPENIEYFARLVLEAAALREAQTLLLQGQEILRSGISTEEEFDEISAKLTQLPSLLNIDQLLHKDPFEHVMTAEQILSMDIPDPDWIIETYLPVGAAAFGGRAKIGKSFAALNMAIAVASGGSVFKKDGCNATEGRVLYLGLEDYVRRLKKRLIPMFGDQKKGLDKLHFVTEWARADEGGIDNLKLWLARYPDTKLIVIDTLAMIRPLSDQESKNGYLSDYLAWKEFRSIAYQHNVAIVVIHHHNKMNPDDWIDSFSGTTGITGGANTLIGLFKKNRDEKRAEIKITGHDFDEEISESLEFDDLTCRWISLGNTKARIAQMETDETLEAIATLGINQKTFTPNDIGEWINASRESADQVPANTIQQRILRLWKEGHLKKIKHGVYKINPENPLPQNETPQNDTPKSDQESQKGESHNVSLSLSGSNQGDQNDKLTKASQAARPIRTLDNDSENDNDTSVSLSQTPKSGSNQGENDKVTNMTAQFSQNDESYASFVEGYTLEAIFAYDFNDPTRAALWEKVLQFLRSFKTMPEKSLREWFGFLLTTDDHESLLSAAERLTQGDG